MYNSHFNDVINVQKRQNLCLVIGVNEIGESRISECWLTDFEAENICGSSYQEFVSVKQVKVTTRFFTNDELNILASSGTKPDKPYISFLA